MADSLLMEGDEASSLNINAKVETLTETKENSAKEEKSLEVNAPSPQEEEAAAVPSQESKPEEEPKNDDQPSKDDLHVTEKNASMEEPAAAEEDKEKPEEVDKLTEAPGGAPKGNIPSEAFPTAEIEDEEYHNSTSSALSEERWEEMFQRLLKFKEMHGHCLVPNRYKEDLQLGAWVTGQRKNYKLLTSGSGKQTTMTMERAQVLIDNGFEWTAKNPRHLMWEVRFAELKDFQSQYGHAQVPIGWEQNVQLANWVSTQRQEYKNLIKGKTSRLNNERVSQLSVLGFAWELQRGGRRRRVTVSSPASKGEARQKRPHPADAEIEDNPAKKAKVVESSDGFAIDDGSAPVISSSGRKRTTLKKKVTKADEAAKCILPGVAIMGGGRDAPSSDRPGQPQRRHGGSANDAGGEVRSQQSPMQNNGMNPMLQQQQVAMAANSSQNSEAFFRAFGNGGGAPWQALPNGAYQFGNPLAQQFGAGGGGAGNPFFPMAAGPYGMMFANGTGGFHRGMDPPQFDQNMSPQEKDFRLRQQQASGFGGGAGMQGGMPFQVSSSGGFNNSSEGDEQQQQHNGMHFQQFPGGAGAGFPQGMGMSNQGGGAVWGMPDNAAAAAQAAQHLQAAAALTAGIDERNIPPHLASVARRMHNPNNMAMGGDGDMMHGMHHNHARRGDPPADPPSMNGNRSPHQMMNTDDNNGGSGMGMMQGVFADADE